MPDWTTWSERISTALANQPTPADMVALCDEAITELMVNGGVVNYTTPAGVSVSRNLDQMQKLREYYRQRQIEDSAGGSSFVSQGVSFA